MWRMPPMGPCMRDARPPPKLSEYGPTLAAAPMVDRTDLNPRYLPVQTNFRPKHGRWGRRDGSFAVARRRR